MPLWCIAIFLFMENSFNNMERFKQIILLKRRILYGRMES